MNNRVSLEVILGGGGGRSPRPLTLFALLNLGMIESLADGLISAGEALLLFYNAENCLFVRKRLKDRSADRVMSHGAQLADLFDILPADEAHREFRHELSTMRTLCLKILEEARQAV
jgi:hypothetical protein